MNDWILSPEMTSALLEQEDCLVVDLCRAETWQRFHLPGAVHVEPAALVSGEKPATGKLPTISRLNALFSGIGYSPDKTIIAYDDEGGGWAGRFIWTLDLIGHRKKHMLDGGIHAWQAAGLPLNSEIRPPRVTAVEVTIDPGLLVTKEDLVAALSSPDTLVWDARSREEYTGARVLAARGGHIPGAVNLDWLQVMDRDNNLKVRADIEAVLASLGIVPGKKIVTHCQTHHRSGLTWIVGKSIGLDIRAYDGSWSEWGNDPATPIETG